MNIQSFEKKTKITILAGKTGPVVDQVDWAMKISLELVSCVADNVFKGFAQILKNTGHFRLKKYKPFINTALTPESGGISKSFHRTLPPKHWI